MTPTNKKPFDCLAFKWSVETEVYREIKDQTPEQQIKYFQAHAESGPFASLLRTLRQHQTHGR